MYSRSETAKWKYLLACDQEFFWNTQLHQTSDKDRSNHLNLQTTIFLIVRNLTLVNLLVQEEPEEIDHVSFFLNT